MRFQLKQVPNVTARLAELERTDPKKARKVKKTLRHLEDPGPSHAGLESHRFKSLDRVVGEEVWESYVENDTPGAWRLFWYYGPGRAVITIIALGPHP